VRIKVNGEEIDLGEKHLMIILGIYRVDGNFLLFNEIKQLLRTNYYYTVKYIEDLKDMGLIRELRRRRIRAYVLTEKGWKVAKTFYDLLKAKKS